MNKGVLQPGRTALAAGQKSAPGFIASGAKTERERAVHLPAELIYQVFDHTPSDLLVRMSHSDSSHLRTLANKVIEAKVSTLKDTLLNPFDALVKAQTPEEKKHVFEESLQPIKPVEKLSIFPYTSETLRSILLPEAQRLVHVQPQGVKLISLASQAHADNQVYDCFVSPGGASIVDVAWSPDQRFGAVRTSEGSAFVFDWSNSLRAIQSYNQIRSLNFAGQRDVILQREDSSFELFSLNSKQRSLIPALSKVDRLAQLESSSLSADQTLLTLNFKNNGRRDPQSVLLEKRAHSANTGNPSESLWTIKLRFKPHSIAFFLQATPRLIVAPRPENYNWSARTKVFALHNGRLELAALLKGAIEPTRQQDFFILNYGLGRDAVIVHEQSIRRIPLGVGLQASLQLSPRGHHIFSEEQNRKTWIKLDDAKVKKTGLARDAVDWQLIHSQTGLLDNAVFSADGDHLLVSGFNYQIVNNRLEKHAAWQILDMKKQGTSLIDKITY